MEWWLLTPMVMWLMILLGQKHANTQFAFATADHFGQQNVAGCTFYAPQNRPVLPSNPVIPPITYDTPSQCR